MASNGQAASIQHSDMKRSHSSDPPAANKRPSSQEGQLPVTVRAVGQTAPRLISILKTADRQYHIENERNPFIHPPRGFDEQFDATRRQPLQTPCKHSWTTQRNQTVLPESDITDVGHAYRLACFCQRCHWHVDLQIKHTVQPCPKPGYPLHHFTNFVRDDEHNEWYQARCSGCGAQLRIDYRRPRLQSEQIELLTSVGKLWQRLEAAKRADPDREHTRAAAPIEVLDAISTYLKDALNSQEDKKIPKLNRRFVISFGEDCRDMLASMGFKDIGDFYLLPRPGPPEPWEWNLRKQLEDTQEELWALMRQLKRNDPNINIEGRKGYDGKMEPFEEDVQLFLSTFEYDKSKTTRRAPTLTLDEQSWYAGLGCLGDFSDDLLAFGFDRQAATDTENIPYYYDCLSAIAKKRNSESLEMKMALLASEGFFGRRDVTNAYKYFTLDPRQDNELTDEFIHGVFESRIGSIPKASEAEAREKLRLIGASRRSQALLDAASNEITDVHNAFRFLEPSYNESNQYPDDYVIALAGVKKAENDATYFQEKVAKAVSLIAEHRNSEALRAYLATGEATLTSDDDELANAYRFYGIQDRTAELDIAVLQTQLDLILDDKHETTERQIRATQYFKLLTEHHKEAPQITMEPDYTKPVGLENPSNYCYLHALLQYFNSIETFRDTILNFEQYEQPIDTADTTDLGSIGGQLITPLHVENGRKLVPHLTKLFKTLESTAASYVQAPNGLAAEALIPPPAIIASRPASPPQTELRNGANRSNDENGKTTDDAESSSESETVRGDESSDITLVGDVIMTPESVADEQQMADAATDSETKDPAGANDGNKDDDTDKSSPPNRPPPVPPRPNLEKKESELAEEYRQQDAHQVAGNVIQRTIAAIKPTSIQRDGERQDRVRDLFYGIVQQYCTQKSEKKLQFSPLYDAYQYIHLSKKPKDVQEGLDITYGRETNVPDEDRPEDKAWEAFSVIKHAPPLLQLYLQNRESDYTRPATDYRSARVAHHMLLNESIQLDRYMESNQSRILSLREESWNLRDHLHKLEENRESLRIKFERALAKGKGNQDKNTDLDSDEAFTAICNILKSDAEDDGMDEEMAELMEDLESWTETDRAAKETIEAEIPMTCAKLDALRLDIVDTPEYRYRIFAIFMYNGSGYGGHWWIYIRDFKNNVWRSYNDANVKIVSEEEVFRKRNPKTEADANIVVYVRDDRKEELCDPLHRVKPVDDDGDVDMGMDGESQSSATATAAATAAATTTTTSTKVAEVEVREIEMKSLPYD